MKTGRNILRKRGLETPRKKSPKKTPKKEMRETLADLVKKQVLQGESEIKYDANRLRQKSKTEICLLKQRESAKMINRKKWYQTIIENAAEVKKVEKLVAEDREMLEEMIEKFSRRTTKSDELLLAIN